MYTLGKWPLICVLDVYKPRSLAILLASCGPQGALLPSLTFVVAGDPLHAVGKRHFSSNKVSENSDLSTREGLSSCRQHKCHL